MGIDLRYPSITGNTEEEQIRQIRNYLFYLADQLRFAFDTLEASANEAKNADQQ